MQRFIWDGDKARANLRKHRISFEIATRVFTDPCALTGKTASKRGEYRWQTLGRVDGITLLLVAHTLEEDRDGAEVIRIISARRADLKERKRYEQNR